MPVNPKRRPLVVLTSDEDLRVGEAIVAVAISTANDSLDPAVYVPLSWHPSGNAKTKQKARCAVVCTWIVEIPPTAIVPYGGWVPPAHLQEIYEKVNGLDP